ncbi:MAG: UTP--glucose-1-phosphate uridylyltransferase [Candidatus Babeliaceae bacterium]
MADITKGIIPAAGIGTRNLPLTKVLPKEMFPLPAMHYLDKIVPAMHYIVEEAIASDVNQLLVITGKNKNMIADYFDTSPYLENFLKERNKLELIASLERIMRLAQFVYIRQSEPLGLGHAVWLARHAIGKEYFGVLLPDDLIISKQPGLAQLIRIARQEKASVIAVQEVPAESISAYGAIGIKKQITPNLFQVSQLVEKPLAHEAPSNLAIVGRYVLSYKIFASLESLSNYAAEELPLTESINHMLHNNERVFAYKINGLRCDIGTSLGWLKTAITFALQDDHSASEMRLFLKEIEKDVSVYFNPSKRAEKML